MVRYTKGKAEDRKEPQGSEKLWFFSYFNIKSKNVGVTLWEKKF